MNQFLSGGLAVAGAAADARKTSGTAGYATRARELPAGATADTRDTALATGAAAGAIELSAGATVAVGVTAAATRVLLEDTVGGRLRWLGSQRRLQRPPRASRQSLPQQLHR